MIDKRTEAVARAIAANKRGLPTDDPRIDKVWSAYCGQARDAIATCRLPDDSIFRRELLLAIAPSLLLMTRDVYTDAGTIISRPEEFADFAAQMVDALARALPTREDIAA